MLKKSRSKSAFLITALLSLPTPALCDEAPKKIDLVPPAARSGMLNNGGGEISEVLKSTKVQNKSGPIPQADVHLSASCRDSDGNVITSKDDRHRQCPTAALEMPSGSSDPQVTTSVGFAIGK